MEIYFEKDDSVKKFKIENKMSVKDVLNEFGVVSESVILVKNGDICLDDANVIDSDESEDPLSCIWGMINILFKI